MENREDLISNNLGLVHSLAKRFKGRGIEYDDLYQAGCIGLIKAIDSFDEERGFKLSTYAVPVILGEIKRLFRDGGTVKVGRALKELSLKATRESSKFSAKEGREPTIKELAEILGVEVESVALALNAARVPLSLTMESEDGETQVDIPIDSHDEKISEKLALKQIIEKLNEKDKNLIILRFFKNQTQTVAGKTLGMTQVQVSRREKVLLKQLREQLIS